jgi:hypothetical protein
MISLPMPHADIVSDERWLEFDAASTSPRIQVQNTMMLELEEFISRNMKSVQVWVEKPAKDASEDNFRDALLLCV